MRKREGEREREMWEGGVKNWVRVSKCVNKKRRGGRERERESKLNERGEAKN